MVRLKEAKSSCDVACDELRAAKELLHTHDIALGAVNVGSVIGSGENTLVRLLFHTQRDINKPIIPLVRFGVWWLW